MWYKNDQPVNAMAVRSINGLVRGRENQKIQRLNPLGFTAATPIVQKCT